MKEFLIDRIRLVNELIHIDTKVHYADLVLILTAVISACSARRWPGKGIDQRRFVELLIQHSLPEAHVNYVCLVSLISDGLISEQDTPWGEKGMSSRIFVDDEIDMPLAEAQSLFPSIPLRKLKRHTYAALIYSWLRCPYAHEYCLGEHSGEVPACNEPARISYIGRAKPDGTIQRRAIFHLEYLSSLARHHVNLVPEAPQNRPPHWWLDFDV